MTLSIEGSADASGNFTGVLMTPLPVSRIGGVRDRATVIEVMGFYLDNDFNSASATAATVHSFISTSALPIGSPTVSFAQMKANPTIVAYLQRNIPASSNGPVIEPNFFPLNDGAGHGVLIATDNIYLSYVVAGALASTPVAFIARMLYRFKEVGIAEYVGIVQSQQ